MDQYRDIFKAIESRDVGGVETFLANGTDPDIRDARGWTPLLKALALEEGELVGALLARGASVHVTGPVRETPLHVAAAIGDARAVQQLLDAGADVHAQALVGGSPLHAAAMGGSVATARLLLAAGADLEARGAVGETPLHFAALCAVAMWRKLSGRMHAAAPYYAVLRDALAARIEYGTERTIHMCRFLLDRGARPVSQDSEGRTPLDWAGASGREALEGPLLRAAGVAMLRLGFLRREERRQFTSAVLTVRPDTPAGEVARKAAAKFGAPARLEWSLRPVASPRTKVEPFVTIRDAVGRLNPFLETVSPAAYDDVIRIGRYFAFCRATEGVDRTFLRSLGIASTPAIVPRISAGAARTGHLDLHLQPFSKLVEFFPVAVASSPRSTYGSGEAVCVLALCTSATAPAGGMARMRLMCMREDVPGSRREVKLRRGLGMATWERLPDGDYTAVLSWDGNEAQCSFTVGSCTGAAASAAWVEGPALDDTGAWRGRARLFQYGTPVSQGVEVNVSLVADSPPQPAEAWSRTYEQGDDQGLVDVRLSNTHADCGGMRFSWRDGREHSAHLSLPGGDAFLAGGVRVVASPHEGSVPAGGVHVSKTPVEGPAVFPLEISAPLGERPAWTATRDLDVVAVTAVFPGCPAATHVFQEVPSGGEIAIPLPAGSAAYGYLCVGALCGNETFEKALPFFRPSAMTVRCSLPEVVAAGEPVRMAIRLEGTRRATLAVWVQDARLVSGGGLDAGMAAARLQNLRDEFRGLEGALPAHFSDHYLDGIFRLQEVAAPVPSPQAKACAPAALRARATLAAPGSLGNLVSPEGTTPLPDPPPSRLFRRIDVQGDPLREAAQGAVLYVGLVETRTGAAEVRLDVPASAATYAVQVVAVDGEHLGLAVASTEFSARRKIGISPGSFPLFLHPDDAGLVQGSLGVSSSVGPVRLEVAVDGRSVNCSHADGTPLAGGVVDASDGEEVTVRVPVTPGHYRVSARAGRLSAEETFSVRAADRPWSHGSRLVVLREGQEWESGAAEGLRALRILADSNEMFRACGQALADYPWRSCEQTTAAMIGAWTAFLAGEQGKAHAALGRLRQGVAFLERAWRDGGFAAYPGDAEACPLVGRRAYRHLATMARLRRWLLPVPGMRADVAVILERVLELLSRAERVYGWSAGGTLDSCEEAWLALENRHGREAALRLALERWTVRNGARGPYGFVSGPGGAVGDRAETCYAAAILLDDEEQRELRSGEILGTLDWLGSQMTEDGRLYSSIDSAALLVLLASARELFVPGVVQVDGGPPVAVAQAPAFLGRGLPGRIRCVDGPVILRVDQEPVPGTPIIPGSSAFRVSLEEGGRAIEEAVTLEDRLELVVEATEVRPGLFVGVTLPPCLALDERSGAGQVFERDFEGSPRLRIPLRAVECSGGRAWHGVVTLRDMFDEGVREDLTLAVVVR